MPDQADLVRTVAAQVRARTPVDEREAASLQEVLAGLAELPDLLASVEGAGVAVDLRVVGQARPLPSSVELSAYRIVQEALTNVVRHAPGASVTVVMTHLPEAVKVEVVNGPAAVGAEPAGPGGGRGLVGMRERAAMLGGTVEAGIGPRGGYRVAALLPVTPAGGATTSGAAGAGAGVAGVSSTEVPS